MQLKLFRHLWGVDFPRAEAFARIKKSPAGYGGIEARVPDADDDAKAFVDLAGEHGFSYIFPIFTGGKDVREHLASFRSQVERAAKLKPMFINSHSGSDAFSRAEATEFFSEAIRIEKGAGIDVGHETHRSRVMFHPWIARDLLDEFESLKLTADYSHWVVVCERLLMDCGDILKKCASRTLHVHARVGYEEGPQVPDPAAPEYAGALKAHESWWDMIWKSQRERGVKISTLTPEFGPPTYLHTLPHTNVPVADLWAICDWQAQRQAKRFAEFANG